jgi:hypothetical protein
MDGSRVRTTPLRPRTLGGDSVTPHSKLYEAIGMTAGSFRNRISAMRARHPDTVLTGSDAFDYGNVGVPDLPLDLVSKLFPVLPRGWLQQLKYRLPRDAGRRPQKHLRRAVLSDDLGIDISWAYPEPLRQVKPETQAVEICPGTENALVPPHANHIGQRIWRVGDDKDERLRRHCAKLRNDALVNRRIGVKQPQPARRVVPIGSAAVFSFAPAEIITNAAPSRSE